MSMSNFVISNKYPCFADELSKMGHNIVFSDAIKAFPQPEQTHVDMQILKNVLLNFLYFNNKLYGKASAIDPNLYGYCMKNNIEIININQGYARCSTLVLNNHSAITADISIKNALEKDGAEVLLIPSGNIKLEGYDYGFIGGASGKISDNTVVFFGNAKSHPYYSSIKEFCSKNNIETKILCKNMPLTDVGGIVKTY